jgi:hypothetical protein
MSIDASLVNQAHNNYCCRKSDVLDPPPGMLEEVEPTPEDE